MLRISSSRWSSSSSAAVAFGGSCCRPNNSRVFIMLDEVANSAIATGSRRRRCWLTSASTSTQLVAAAGGGRRGPSAVSKIRDLHLRDGNHRSFRSFGCSANIIRHSAAGTTTACPVPPRMLPVHDRSDDYCYRHRLHHQLQQRRHLKWVPLAYRGAAAPASAAKQNGYVQSGGGRGRKAKNNRRGGGGRRRQNNSRGDGRGESSSSPSASSSRGDEGFGGIGGKEGHGRSGQQGGKRVGGRARTGGGGGGDGDFPVNRAEEASGRKPARAAAARKEAPSFKREETALRQHEEDLLGLQRQLLRLVDEYRKPFLSSTSTSNSDGEGSPPRDGGQQSRGGADGEVQRLTTKIGIRIEYEDPSDRRRAVIRAASRKIRGVFQDIHENIDVAVSMRHIERTDDVFRNLCRALQDTISSSMKLHQQQQRLRERRRKHNVGSKNDENYIIVNNEADGGELIDMAEAALAALVKVRSDRSLLVDSTKTWAASSQLSPRDADDDSVADAQRSYYPKGNAGGGIGGSSPSSHWLSLVQSLLLSPASTGDRPKADSADDGEDDDSYDDEGARNRETTNDLIAHEDPKLGVTKDLLAMVMNALASQAKTSTSDTNEGPSSPLVSQKQQQERLYRAARRMIDLLDVMPSNWIPDTGLVQQILDILCKVGTLESARLCHTTFKRHQDRLRFSQVLQAYLEACKNENFDASQSDDTNKVLLAAHGALDVLHEEWTANLPRNKLARIVQSSMVLNGFCVAEKRGVRVPALHEKAERLIKRSIGGEAYGILQDPQKWRKVTETSKSISTDASGTAMDDRTLPLVNFLAQAYTLGESPQFEKAKLLLEYMVQHDRQGVGRFMIYPMVDTYNSVLLSIIREHENKPQKKSPTGGEEHVEEGGVKEASTTDIDVSGEEKTEDSLEYADSMLDYMLSGRERTFWPNDETFSYMFRLLVATKPKDIGQRAEDLLSKMEIRRTIALLDATSDHNDPSTIKIPLSIYHRVLRCWFEAAKADETTEYNSACAQSAVKVLEKLYTQSTPFLMDDGETLLASVPRNLYDIQLRPTRQTYRLVWQTCLHAIPHDDKAIDAAFAAYAISKERGEAAFSQDFLDILSSCVEKLPENSEKRDASEARLRAVQQGL